MQQATLKVPASTINWRVYKDASNCERYPWVLEINGKEWNTYNDESSALMAVPASVIHFLPTFDDLELVYTNKK